MSWNKISGNGTDGKSAYQIWLDHGNTGAETDFLNSLKGAPGTSGSVSGALVGKRLALLGDSIMAALSGASAIANRTGATVENKAKAGASIALRTNVNMAPTWDPWALCTVSKVGATNSIPIETYDYAVIWSGTNDWGNGNPLGTIDSMDELTVLGAYNVAIQNFLTRKPDLKLMIITPTHRFDMDDTMSVAGSTLRQFSDGIIAVANKYSIPVFDMMKNSMISTFNKATWMNADNLHPNTTANAMLVQKIGSFIIANY